MNTVAKNIRRLRLLNKMTQDQLAEKMYVTRQTISNWETEKAHPDIEALNALAGIFNTDLNELIYGVPRGNYQQYQKRFVNMIPILILLILIVGIANWIPLPISVRHSPEFDSVAPLLFIVPILAEVIIFFCLGVLILAVFSLWFDCSLKMKNIRMLLLISVVLLIPFICAAVGFFWQLISGEPHTRLLRDIYVYRWVRVLLIWFFPFMSGISSFLFFNRQSLTNQPEQD